jgi:hypothetical protein
MSTTPAKPALIRVQFDASADTVAALDELVIVFDTLTRAGAIRKAINVLLRIANAMRTDGEPSLVVQRKDGTLERWIF